MTREDLGPIIAEAIAQAGDGQADRVAQAVQRAINDILELHEAALKKDPAA